MNNVRVKQLTITSCDDCKFRVYKHPHNYCGATYSSHYVQLPEEIDEHLGIPIPDTCPLPDYKP